METLLSRKLFKVGTEYRFPELYHYSRNRRSHAIFKVNYSSIVFKDFINSDSLETITAKLEPMLANVEPGTRFQFERVGYFCADKDHSPEKPLFNRTLTLRAPRKVN